MIKTKKTKEILSEWRSFEKRSLNESSYSPSSGAQSIKKAVADFLACPESDLSDSSYIGEPIDEEFEFLIEAIKNEGGLPTSVSLNDMIFTDDQTCTIDWNKTGLNITFPSNIDSSCLANRSEWEVCWMKNQINRDGT